MVSRDAPWPYSSLLLLALPPDLVAEGVPRGPSPSSGSSRPASAGSPIVSFLKLFERRQRLGKALLATDAALANELTSEERQDFDLIFHPPSNRLDSGVISEMAQQSTSVPEATSALSTTPCWGNHWVMAPRALRPCAPGCVCTCVPCTLKRTPACAPHASADPT